MRRFARFGALALVLALLPVLFGCGGTGTAVPVNARNAPEAVAIVAVVIAEDSVRLGAGESYQFSATVTGHSNISVTWSLSGCTGAACGTISPTGNYTAPLAIAAMATVTVTATSQADPTKFDTVVVHQMPVAVLIRPPTATVLPGATLNFTAVVQYDIRNGGVTWALGPACSDATCGTLSNIGNTSVSYTAPATVPDLPTATLTAISVPDNSKTAQVMITVSATPLKLEEGDYAFFFNGWEGELYGPVVVVAGHFHADDSRNITDGVEDINSAFGVSQSVSFTGAYSIEPDRQGSFTITSAQGTATYRMTVDPSGRKGKFIKCDGLPTSGPITGTGYFELQDKAAFSLSAMAGPYAIGMFGRVKTEPIASVGRFTASTAGALSSGRMDVTTLSGTLESFTDLALTGSFNAPSATSGRGTATVTLTPSPGGIAGTFNLAYYVISDQKVVLVQTDVRGSTVPVLSGQIRRQNGSFSAASFNGPTIFSSAGETWFGSTATVGQMVPDGSGSMTGIIDENSVAITDDAPVLNEAFSGTYAVEADGRSTMTLQVVSRPSFTEIAYFFAQSEGFLMETGRAAVAFGSFKPQTVGPFTAASLSGTLPTNTAAERLFSWGKNECGLTTFDGNSAVISNMYVYVSYLGTVQDSDSAGTYAVTANGRGTLTFSSPTSSQVMVFWIISPTELVGIATVNPGDTEPVLLEYKK